ncbi:hypothetical protein V8C35DRAFT_73008 [Trichoderma chlorosporum]
MASIRRTPFPGAPTADKGNVQGQKASKHDSEKDSQAANDGPARMVAEGAGRRSLSGRYNVKVDTQTGGAACTIPIQTTAGRGDFGPSLSLEYASGAAGANGIFGMGWHLAGVDHIARRTTAAIPKYDESDMFVHSNLGDLVLSDEPEKRIDGYRVREYRARVESVPVCIQRWDKNDSDETFWRTISSANVVTVYGREDSSQISHHTSSQAKRTFSWLASESYDSHGNSTRYRYKTENDAGIGYGIDVCEAHRRDIASYPQRYLKSILYGNTTPCRNPQAWDELVSPAAWMFEVVFDYGEHNNEQPTTEEEQSWELRPDPFSTYNSAFEIRTYRRCHRVLMFHHFPSPAQLGRQDCLVASTCFEYQTDERSRVTYLQSCVQKGHSPKGANSYWTVSLPPVGFTYTAAPLLADLPMEELDLRMTGLTTSAAQWVDLDSEGAPGVLIKVDGAGWYYQRNLTLDDQPQVGDPRPFTTPNVTHSSADWDFEDVGGDGLPDVVVNAKDGALRGFYEHEEDGGWLNFVPFETYPVVDDPSSVHRVDLCGNGRADILNMATQTWHSSRGPRGFGAAQSAPGAPLLALQDPASLVQLWDMTGDGLADIVQVSNRSICYWPNTGHGTFGHKVIMGNAPCMAPDEAFSLQCIRSGDFTGSGTTDIVYLQSQGGAVVYYNRSGNNWSEGHVIPFFPSLSRVSAVDVLDLGGRGTACLCWTSDLHSTAEDGLGMVRFVDLMGKRRPGLLKKWSNGIGSETTFTYRSSFSFSREDESQGRSWSTRLPFPLQCVDHAVTVDHVALVSCSTRYAYHNGYYDYAERQFRGFQMVESWDAEEFDLASATQFQRPPVLTRQWYYLGLPRVDQANLPHIFETNAPKHDAIASAVIPPGIDQGAIEEAYRALSGRGRRTEVYSVDPSDEKAALPYTISQQNHEVLFSQHSPHLASRVNSHEEINTHYERVAVRDGAGQLTLSYDEARVQQRLILETDSYGNVLLEASVQYGKASSNLPDLEARERQEETVITYTENVYTNAVRTDGYFQAPLLSETQQYRCFAKNNIDNRYTWEDMAKENAKLLRAAMEISVDDGSDADMDPGSDARGYRILLEKKCILYTKGDLRKPLDPKVLEKFSILYQSYELAFTSGSLGKAVSGSIASTSLDQPATALHAPVDSKTLINNGYVELVEGSGVWWVPSTRFIFGDGSRDGQLDAARRQFYLPNAEIDPYGNTTTKVYDEYYLLVTSTTNAVGSTTTCVSDYARLQPIHVTDANENRTQTSVDPLGQVIGVAVMGKEQSPTGDSLDGFEGEIGEKTLAAFFGNPSGPTARSLLSTATSRKIYHVNAYHDTLKAIAGSAVPTWMAELTRHDHSGPDDTVQSHISVQITYFNGSGSPFQTCSLSYQEEKTKEVTWDFSGWVVQDNKGQPAQEFQPFQALSHTFRHQSEGPDQTLSPLAATHLRDPLGRVIGVVNADHTWSKTVFTPWTQLDYDTGDTVLIEDPATDIDVGQHFRRLDRSLYFPTWYGKRTADTYPLKQRRLASQSQVYADTPTIAHLDAVGQKIVTETGKNDDRRLFHRHYDLRGNCVKIRDPLNRVAETAQYDFLGRLVESRNMDRGQRRMFPAADGVPILSWSDRGTRRRIEYDGLRRVKSVWVLRRDSSAEILTCKYIYGEALPSAAEDNLHGQLYQCYDQAGLRTNAKFDVLGGCMRSTLRYATNFSESIDWAVIKADMLESEEYATTIQYNALGLPIESVSPDLGVIRREYDVAGRLKSLQSLDVDQSAITSSVDVIEYAADGQIDRIVYGNGSVTTNTYEEDTRRLSTTRTTRRRGGGQNSSNTFEEQAQRLIRNSPTRGSGSREALQDVAYTYDCLGKVVLVDDIGSAVSDANPGSASPTREFQYDCFGQLIQATGRIQVDPNSKHLSPFSFNTHTPKSLEGNDQIAIRYTENYTYDNVGNIKTMAILPGSGYSGWTRRYTYEEQSCILPGELGNRLSRTEVSGRTEEYKYDDDAGRHGCMTSIPGYSCLSWDLDDRLHSFSTQRVVTAPDDSPNELGTSRAETTWYIYDADGTRVRKVTQRLTAADGIPKVSKDTRYLLMGDVYATYRGDGVTELRTTKTLNVYDDVLGGSPVALVESSTSTSRPLTRYRVSELLELDGEGNMVSYQEYSPYGSTTYQAGTMEASRSYRFASYRWDSESGLYSCGARYYACWLGRWTSADPWGTVDGLNLFVYCGNDPVNFHDPGGTMFSSSKTSKKAQKEGSKADNSSNRGQSGKQPLSPESGKSKATDPPDDGGGGWTTVGDAKKPKPKFDTVQSEPAEGYTRLYRASDRARARRFITQSDVNAVITGVTGDFNHEGGNTSYWTDNEGSALKHGKYYANSDPTLMWVDVPTSMLEDATVKNYGKSPDSLEWQDRVNLDRRGIPDKEISSAYPTVVVDRRAEISTGPESLIKNDAYNKPAHLTTYEMNPLKIDGKYAMQFALKGAALDSLVGFDVKGMQPIKLEPRKPANPQSSQGQSTSTGRPGGYNGDKGGSGNRGGYGANRGGYNGHKRGF